MRRNAHLFILWQYTKWKKLGSEKFSLTKGLSFEKVTKGGKKKIYYETPINNYKITRKIQLPQAGAASDNNFKTTTFHYCLMRWKHEIHSEQASV